ncbi:MAG: matrixin family metalloprotease [Dehalococcoidia bacterium]|nr:matrixin family metalloprotease [Dehalococcoidia bacterium]
MDENRSATKMGPARVAGMVAQAKGRSDPRLAPPQPTWSVPRLTLSGFVLGLGFWAVVLFSVAIFSGSAYRLLGTRWDHLALGYRADSAVGAYADAAFAQWAEASPLQGSAGGHDVEITVKPLLPPVFYAGQPAQANLSQDGTRITHCEVRLDPVAFFQLSEAGRQNTVTHEIGHCLGLNHSDQPGIMMNPLLYNFSADDAAAVAAVYGPREAHVVAPMPTPPSVVAADSRPMVAPVPLRAGWNLITWDGRASAPGACGCLAVYALVDSGWQHWSAGGPAYANTLQALRSGEPYWVLAR